MPPKEERRGITPAEREAVGAAPGPDAPKRKKKEIIPSPFIIEPVFAFYLFLGAGLFSALYAPITDCDETFNYWEPTHYLSHGYGLQTWEYSPDYAIRSWFYITLHAIIGNIRRILPRPTKLAEFYFVRYALAFVCASCQVVMYRVITLTIHPRIGVFFIMAMVLSPGNFHASTAYLPSSFAMYFAMLGAASFMDWTKGVKTTMGMFWFCVGGFVGWPFAIALSLPFMLEEAVFAVFGSKDGLIESIVRVGRGVIAGIVVITFDSLINAFFYRKLEIVPWNIIKYNVLSKGGGPTLYGTEPWTYYFRNLALNFNLWFVLALAALPLFILQKAFAPSGRGFQSGLRTIVFISPFYLWLAIFTSQPHKEERFMYPAYPFLALNAAISVHIILSAIGHLDRNTLLGRVPKQLKLIVAVILPFVVVLYFFILRTAGVITGYSAPMNLYTPTLGAGLRPAEQGLVGGRGENVCFGKDWYRFPTSYFLPRDMHAKFIQSEFRGLLPGEFNEATTGFGFFGGTWMPTMGMNDRNEQDMGKYVDMRACNYLVDTQYPERIAAGETPSADEPDYVADRDKWEEVLCLPFMDAAKTGTVARMLWLPSFVPEQYQRKWGRQCLLKRQR